MLAEQPYPLFLGIKNKKENCLLTSSEHCPLSPVHGQQDPSPEADALRKIDAPPEVHGQQPAAEVHAAEVEDGRVADVRQAAEVPVLKGLIDRVVEVAVGDFVGDHPWGSLSELVELPGEVLSLLVGALGGGGQ